MMFINVIHSKNDKMIMIRWCSDILWKSDVQSVMIVSLTTQDINKDQYNNKLIIKLKI